MNGHGIEIRSPHSPVSEVNRGDSPFISFVLAYQHHDVAGITKYRAFNDPETMGLVIKDLLGIGYPELVEGDGIPYQEVEPRQVVDKNEAMAAAEDVRSAFETHPEAIMLDFVGGSKIEVKQMTDRQICR